MYALQNGKYKKTPASTMATICNGAIAVRDTATPALVFVIEDTDAAIQSSRFHTRNCFTMLLLKVKLL